MIHLYYIITLYVYMLFKHILLIFAFKISSNETLRPEFNKRIVFVHFQTVFSLDAQSTCGPNHIFCPGKTPFLKYNCCYCYMLACSNIDCVLFVAVSGYSAQHWSGNALKSHQLSYRSLMWGLDLKIGLYPTKTLVQKC